MITAIGYNIPAMQLVCHLVALGNITNIVPSLDQAHYQYRPFLDGYIAHPDIGSAHKVYNQSVTPIQARNLCAREGSQLAVIDTFKKMQYLRHHVESGKYLIAGIQRSGSEWININTGLPVSSIPWKSGEPARSGDCLFLTRDHEGLGNWPCTDTEYYACEFPISA